MRMDGSSARSESRSSCASHTVHLQTMGGRSGPSSFQRFHNWAVNSMTGPTTKGVGLLTTSMLLATTKDGVARVRSARASCERDVTILEGLANGVVVPCAGAHTVALQPHLYHGKAAFLRYPASGIAGPKAVVHAAILEKALHGKVAL